MMVEPTKSPRRRRLIVATACTQALAVLAGGVLGFHLLRHRFAHSMADAVYARNERTLDTLAVAVRELRAPELAYGTWEWERAQALVDALQTPPGSRVCILDSGGAVLCEPGLLDDPTLRGRSLGGLVIERPGGERTTVGAGSSGADLHGQVGMIGEGTQFVSARPLTELDVQLVIMQPEWGLISLGEAGRQEAGWLVGGLAAMAAGLTVGLGVLVAGRYERALRRHNREIDREVHERTERTVAARNALIVGLAKLADYRDSGHGAHLDRICPYAAMIAEQLRGRFEEITPTWVERLRLAASLHDIGKAAVSDTVLLKPGELSGPERASMERHAVVGADSLLALRRQMGDDPLLNMAIQVALEHHERWDGKGYPLALKGDQIALSARIVAVADVYDALTSTRVYKEACTHEKACAIIREGRGTQFDPRVVEAFEQVSDRIDELRMRPAPAPLEAGEAKRAA